VRSINLSRGLLLFRSIVDLTPVCGRRLAKYIFPRGTWKFGNLAMLVILLMTFAECGSDVATHIRLG
jgi:hypothetical protein